MCLVQNNAGGNDSKRNEYSIINTSFIKYITFLYRFSNGGPDPQAAARGLWKCLEKV